MCSRVNPVGFQKRFCTQLRAKTQEPSVPPGGWGLRAPGVGRSGRGLGSGHGAEPPPLADPSSQPRLAYSGGTVVRAQQALITEAPLYGLVRARRGSAVPAQRCGRLARTSWARRRRPQPAAAMSLPGTATESRRLRLATSSPCLGIGLDAPSQGGPGCLQTLDF